MVGSGKIALLKLCQATLGSICDDHFVQAQRIDKLVDKRSKQCE
jgi:hypothetical protein